MLSANPSPKETNHNKVRAIGPGGHSLAESRRTCRALLYFDITEGSVVPSPGRAAMDSGQTAMDGGPAPVLSINPASIIAGALKQPSRAVSIAKLPILTSGKS